MSKLKKYQPKIVLVVGAVLLCLVAFYAGRLSLAPDSPEIEIMPDPEPEKISVILTETGDKKLTGKIEGTASIKLNGENIETSEFESNTGAILTVYNDLFELTTPLGIAKFEAGSAAAAGVAPTGAQFIASKNGSKYHLVGSGTAKRIKDENKVYFTSQEEAKTAGFEPGKSVK